MTADDLVRILKSHGCAPERQRNLPELRDAVHETVHVLQSGAKTWDREKLHSALMIKAIKDAKPFGMNPNVMLVRYELQARAVEMLACKRFGIPYDLPAWAHIMWMETAKTLNVDIGRDVEKSILVVSKQYATQALLDRVLAFKEKSNGKGRKATKRGRDDQDGALSDSRRGLHAPRSRAAARR